MNFIFKKYSATSDIPVLVMLNLFIQEVCTEMSVSDGKWSDTTCNKIGTMICKVPKTLPIPNNNSPSTNVQPDASSSHGRREL